MPEEATSKYFVARVGALSPDVEARLARWAGESCAAHCLARDGGGNVTLYMQRTEAKTARGMNSLVRTLTGRWKMPLGNLGSGWLRLSNEEEFRAAALPPPPELRPPGDPAGPDQCRLSQDFDQRAWILLQELSPGFDWRAEEMYRQLAMRRSSAALAAY